MQGWDAISENESAQEKIYRRGRLWATEGEVAPSHPDRTEAGERGRTKARAALPHSKALKRETRQEDLAVVFGGETVGHPGEIIGDGSHDTITVNAALTAAGQMIGMVPIVFE